jgi:hypothetical protein
MGDRANIIVKDGSEQVCLYTHWGGYGLPEVLRSAFIRGEDRLDDFQYLTRIIFCEMVKDEILETTGFGITVEVGDGGDQIIIVDVDAKTVSVGDNKPLSFVDFIKNGSPWSEIEEEE